MDNSREEVDLLVLFSSRLNPEQTLLILLIKFSYFYLDILGKNNIEILILIRYECPMVTSSGGLIDILEIAMNVCCKQHNYCHGCSHLTYCTNLWDRASEESFEKPFSPQDLKAYIKEFNQLWQKKAN